MTDEAGHGPPPDGIGEATFRSVMSRFAGAVIIVATGSATDPAGRRGMTVTAVSSLSSRPPSVVVCLNRLAGTCRQVLALGRFSVNLLATSHVELATTFAGHRELYGSGRFGDADWTVGMLGVPVLASALSSFECHVSKSFDYGTHTVFIGDILAARSGDGDPLIYHRQRFRDLGIGVEPPLAEVMEGTAV